MCRRLIGPHSGSDRGHHATSGGGDVRDGDDSPPRLDDAGLRRTHVSFRLTQFLHGSPSSHYGTCRQSNTATPSVGLEASGLP